jgi:hypothetical protein
VYLIEKQIEIIVINSHRSRARLKVNLRAETDRSGQEKWPRSPAAAAFAAAKETVKPPAEFFQTHFGNKTGFVGKQNPKNQSCEQLSNGVKRKTVSFPQSVGEKPAGYANETTNFQPTVFHKAACKNHIV